MTPGKRWSIIATLLTFTVAAAAWVRNEPTDSDALIVTMPNSKKAPAASQPAMSLNASQADKRSSMHINLDKLAARNPGTLVKDPFAVSAPKPKPKRSRRGGKAVPVAQPKPTAPPVPFTYMGKLRSGPDTAVFLTEGDRNLILRQGDTIDSTYRVEAIADSEITLVYLPLEQRQTIHIGEPP